MGNELRFMDFLDMLMKRNGILNKYWITDTGRNGIVDVRATP